MRRIFLLLTFFLTLFYLVSAININLSSGDKLDISNWQNVNNITSKINLDSSNLSVNGKLVTNYKICSGNSCLGECSDGKVWDTNTNSCILPASTPETAGTTCKTILEEIPGISSGIKRIDPDGEGGVDSFSVYCDMTTDGGGWTLIAKDDNTTSYNGDNSISYYYDNYPGDIVGYRLNDANYVALMSQSTYGKHTYEGHTKTIYWYKNQLSEDDLTTLKYNYCSSCSNKRWSMFKTGSLGWAGYCRTLSDSAHEETTLYQSWNNGTLGGSLVVDYWKYNRGWTTPYNMNLTIWVK